MSQKNYDWKRFWCPRSGRINLADGGYVDDPESKWGNAGNPDLVTLEEVAETRCLILLGEPGIGKSQELEKLRDYTENLIDEDDQIIVLDLEDFNDKDKLHEKLFDSQAFIDWKNGIHRLYLFLDSLDQGWLTVSKLPTLLVDEFKNLDNVSGKQSLIKPSFGLVLALKTGFLGKNAEIKGRPNLSRLYLRLVCRVFPFSQAKDGFEELWKNHYSSYCLMPLSESNIKAAFNANSLNADQCWEEIKNKGLSSLAIKPISLRFIIDILKKNCGQLPQDISIVNIYLDGCRNLCKEPKDKDRHPLKSLSNLAINQRLSIAARIAAIIIFCLRTNIWTEETLEDYDSSADVEYEELCGRCQDTKVEQELTIELSMIKEVLDTTLFSNRKSNRMGWAHKTYAEFLAAWYLKEHEIPLAQIKQLIFSSEDPDHKLIPQLHETAVWLASMRLDVFEEIVKTDPDVLLQSDVPTDAKIRSSIVNNLLKQYEEGKLYFQISNHYRHYAKLKYPKLMEQLRPYIYDSNKQIEARYFAVNITQICKIFEFQDDLIKLALDSSEPIDLRVSAVQAIHAVGDAATKLKLKPLAIQKIPEDKNDQLKDDVIQLLWPDHLNIEEILQSVANFSGQYSSFINYNVVPQLCPDHLVVALDWLKKQERQQFGDRLDRLGDAILFKAWENLDSPGIVEGFIEVALVQRQTFNRFVTYSGAVKENFSSLLLQDREKRRKFIKQAILMISEIGEELSFARFFLTGSIATPGDIKWMLICIQEADSEKIQKNWATLINITVHFAQEIAADAATEILEVSKVNPILCNELSYWVKTIDLNSAEAVQAYIKYLKQQASQQYIQSSLLEPLPKEQILQWLDELEHGNLDAWWRLNLEMTLSSEGTPHNYESELDLTKLLGWQKADEVTRRRIVRGAKNYIQQQDNVDYSWVGTNTFNRPALAGCRALLLLLEKDLDFFEKLSSEIWKRWTPIIIASEIWKRWTPVIVGARSTEAQKDSYFKLFEYAYEKSSSQFLETLMIVIDKQNEEGNYLFVIECVHQCLDKNLQLALLKKAKDPLLKPECTGQLLEVLLKQELTEAKDFAKSLIYLPLPLDENDCKKILIAARTLVEHSDPSSWSFIWELIQQDLSFGRKVFESVAYHSGLFGVELSLTEIQLTDLYIWLVNEYPYEEDPDHGNKGKARTLTPRDAIARLRDNVLWQLKEKGTLEACTQIQRLIQELPDLPSLGKVLIDAQANMRRNTWKPMEPKQFLEFIIRKDPSHLDLFNEISEVNRSIKKMENEPKIDQSVHIDNSKISGVVRTGDGDIQNINNSSATKKEFDWKFWLTIAVGLLTVTASGVFNNEIRNFLFNENSSPQMDDNSEGESLKNDN